MTPNTQTPDLAIALWDDLWQAYRQEVVYAQQYQAMIEADGGTLANDHIAFRSLDMAVTLSTGVVELGITYLEPWVHFLGYEVAGEYDFPDQHLHAKHYRHPQQALYDLPKLFISELKVSALPEAIADAIAQTVTTGQFLQISALENQPIATQIQSLKQLFTRPWHPPKKSVIEVVDPVSQYGAWVLLHGYRVNHFTGYVNRQDSLRYSDIESTIVGLKALGIPMKAEIEGNCETGLRQTATQAIRTPVQVENESKEIESMEWPYAYYEIAERFPLSGSSQLFEGFLSAQAKQLFQMTQRSPHPAPE